MSDYLSLTHADRATFLAREATARTARPEFQYLAVADTARQGDLLLQRVRSLTAAERKRLDATPTGGVVLAAGSHGEHRLISDAFLATETGFHLGATGLVVHTDAPDGRHKTLALCPGVWNKAVQQELSASDYLPVQARD